MKSVSIVLILAMFSILGACDRVFSKLTIKNESSDRVSNIIVKHSEGSSELGDLEPRSETEFNGYLSGEGAPVIIYTIKGKRISYQSCYYTGGMPARGEVTIHNNGTTQLCH